MSFTPLKIIHVARGELAPESEDDLGRFARAFSTRDDLLLEFVHINNGGDTTAHLLALGAHVHVIDDSDLSSLGILWKLRRCLRHAGPQVVQSHQPDMHPLTTLAALGLDAACVRVLVPSMVYGAMRARPHLWLDSISARLQHAGISVSHELTADARRRMPWLLVQTIEYGLDAARFTRAAHAACDEDGGHGVRVAWAGDLIHDTRPDLFLAAAHRLNGDYPEMFSFYLFGGDGAVRHECARFIRRHALENTLHLGTLSELPVWLDRMNVIVFPHERRVPEAVLAEAMLRGIPVLAYPSEAASALLAYGKYGWLVREQTHHAYADTLLKMAKDPEKTAARARAAQQHAMTRFSLNGAADRCMELYQSLTAKPPKQRRVVYD